MNQSKFKTAYGIGKFLEVFGWLVMVLGIIGGLASINSIRSLAILIIAGGIITGVVIVFFAQVILIIIEIERNTSETSADLRKTNTMLAESLGKILTKLNS